MLPASNCSPKVTPRTRYISGRHRATGHHLGQIQSNPLAVSRRPLLSFASSPGPSTRSSPRPPPTFVRVRASARPSFLLDLSGFLLVHLVPLRPLARVALCQKITRWSLEHASPFGPLFLVHPLLLVSLHFICSILSLSSLSPLAPPLPILLFLSPGPRTELSSYKTTAPGPRLFRKLDPCRFPSLDRLESLKPAASIAVLESQLGPDLFAKARRPAPRLTARLSSTSNRKPRPFGHVHSAHISY